jgi:hypothetical protein
MVQDNDIDSAEVLSESQIRTEQGQSNGRVHT